jgi:hypothetical protein
MTIHKTFGVDFNLGFRPTPVDYSAPKHPASLPHDPLPAGFGVNLRLALETHVIQQHEERQRNFGFRPAPVDYSKPVVSAPEPSVGVTKSFGVDLRQLLSDDVVAKSRAQAADPDQARIRADYVAPELTVRHGTPASTPS